MGQLSEKEKEEIIEILNKIDMQIIEGKKKTKDPYILKIYTDLENELSKIKK